MATDTARNKIVLFGGGFASLNDTWEWNGSTWRQMSPCVSPQHRGLHAMTFDSARAKTIVHGGCRSNGCPNGETWELQIGAQCTYTIADPAFAEGSVTFTPLPPPTTGPVVYYPNLTARVRELAGYSVVGKSVRFFTKPSDAFPNETLICEDETDANGVATCSNPIATPEIFAGDGYVARFAGDNEHVGSEGSAPSHRIRLSNCPLIGNCP